MRDREHGRTEPSYVASEQADARPLSELSLSDAVAWAVVERAPDGIVAVDEAGQIVLANDKLTVLFGYERAELLGQPIELLVPAALAEQHRAHRQGYQDDPHTRPMGAGLELRGRHRDGPEFPVEISLSPLATAEGQLVIAVVRDVTDRVRDAEQLQAAERALARVEDQERIARDLHDLVLQDLYGLGLTVQAVASQATEPVAGRLAEAVDTLDNAIRSIRTVVFGLSHRQRGEADGLQGRLLALVEDAARPLGFMPKVRFQGPVETAVPGRLHDQVLAVVHEALSNVARHAEASQVAVEIVAEDRCLVRVIDDGRGLAAGAIGTGRGLDNLRARADEVGGRFQVGRSGSGGTVLEWSAPLEQ